MELPAASGISECNLAEFASLLRRIQRFKPFRNTPIPESLSEARARLEQAHPSGKAGIAADMELLHNVSLVLVRQPEPISMGELSRLLDVPFSTATRIVDWVVQSGYAERLQDPQDRRVVRVGLTPGGQKIYQISSDFIKSTFESWLGGFTQEECRTLVDLLKKLVDAMEELAKE